jgi:hypothetical protein
MISPHVRAQYGTYRGHTLLPSNVCAHCGIDDDPETTRRWELDEDGDRMCSECAKKETTEHTCNVCGLPISHEVHRGWGPCE